MRAILIAASVPESLLGVTRGAPSSLLPLGDRPMFQHVLERLAASGVRRVDLVLCAGAEQVERLAGDGRRWGLEVVVHLTRDPAQPCRALPRLLTNEAAVLMHADRLPDVELHQLVSASTAGPVLVEEAPGRWAGWAAVTGAHLAAVPPEAGEQEIADVLRRLPGATVHPAPRVLSTATPEAFIASQRLLLAGGFPGIEIRGRQISPGVWVGRGAVIAPSAVLTAPVVIGELAEVGAESCLGPNTVVAAGSVLGPGSTAREALISSETFLGEGLELHRAIVAGDHLVNLDLGATVAIPDPALLAPLGGPDERPVGWLSRIAAGALLVLAAPLLVLTAGVCLARRGPTLHRWFAATTPFRSGGTTAGFSWHTFLVPGAAAHPWAHLVLHVLPSLLAVVRGHMGIVGVEPRSPAALSTIEPEWRDLITRVRPGVITEALAIHGPGAPASERVLGDAWYAAHSSRRYDARLLVAYVSRLLWGQPAPVAVPET